jgi:endonuclease G
MQEYHLTKKETRTMKTTPMRLLIATVAILMSISVLAALPASSTNKIPVTPQESVSIHLTLGNPSGAIADTSSPDNFLMVKPQYVLSYNNTKGGPNWVSWHLQASDIGTEERGDFHPDDSEPAGFKKITKADYTNSGFDRGHICNSKDRTDTRENNDATFFMTNILPQAPDNNQGPWVKLENFERDLAKQGNEVYIIAGAFGAGGTGKNGTSTTIASGKVNVPKTFWKVMVILPLGTNDLSRINDSTRAIAVCMPNRQGIRNTDWHTFVTTIRNVEAATGYNFLSEVPTSAQNAVETRRDSVGIGPATANPCQ